MAKSVLTVSKLERLDVDYDEEADVLYISFGPPSWLPIAGSWRTMLWSATREKE